MSTINDGGPAFPRHAYDGHDGIPLRDWFATHATEEDILAAQGTYRLVSRYEARYIHADAMLRAREVKP
jgi:hypothetical protein